MSTYPGDVWQLAEEQLLEPLVYVDRIEITDPEGTNLHADITEEMAQRWAAGAYQRGHLYMFPNQATGRFGYSFVNYPAFQAEVAAARADRADRRRPRRHAGPRRLLPALGGLLQERVHLGREGRRRAGRGAEGVPALPGPQRADVPVSQPAGLLVPLRDRVRLASEELPSSRRRWRRPATRVPSASARGVIHWGLGIRLWHDPDAPTESKKWREFTEEHNVAFDHGWHTQTYFTTYKVRLRNANKWVNILDKGHMTSLDNPEVRALASRYGDPNYLLTEDWIPEVPGINAPGDYLKDYAPNPGDYAFKVMEQGEERHLRALLPGCRHEDHLRRAAARGRRQGRAGDAGRRQAATSSGSRPGPAASH